MGCRKGVRQIKKSEGGRERERGPKFNQLSVILTLLSIASIDQGLGEKQNKIVQRQKGEIKSVLPQHQPLSTAAPLLFITLTLSLWEVMGI